MEPKVLFQVMLNTTPYTAQIFIFSTLSKFNIFYLLHLITLNNWSVIYTMVHNALLPKLLEATGAVYYTPQF